MVFFNKLKSTLYEQIFFIFAFIIFMVVYYFLNVKALNVVVIPGFITYFSYKILKDKFSLKFEKENTTNTKEEDIEKLATDKAKMFTYKIGFFIYIFYIEFYFLGLPKLDFLPVPFDNMLFWYVIFLVFYQYLKYKKIKIYNIYIYCFLIFIFFIPIINKILELLNKGV